MMQKGRKHTYDSNGEQNLQNNLQITSNDWIIIITMISTILGMTIRNKQKKTLFRSKKTSWYVAPTDTNCFPTRTSRPKDVISGQKRPVGSWRPPLPRAANTPRDFGRCARASTCRWAPAAAEWSRSTLVVVVVVGVVVVDPGSGW